MLQSLNLNIEQAVRIKDTKAIISLFREYQSLPNLPVPPDRVNTETELLDGLNKLRTQVLPPFWARPVRINPPNLIPLDMVVVTDSETLENRTMPTTAMLRTESVQNHPYLGYVESDPAKPGNLIFHVTGKLSVDPLLEWLLRQQLNQNGEPYAGSVTDLKFSAKMETIPGLDQNAFEVAVNGDVLDVTGSIPETAANLFLFKLGSDPGIRFDLMSTYERVAGNTVLSVAGPSVPIYLSSLRRENQIVQVDSGQLKDFGSSGVTVNYVTDNTGKAFVLNPALTIKPGSTTSLPPELAAMSGLKVPPEAVEYADINPFSLTTDFYVAADPQIFQRIIVTNRLAAFDANRGGALRYLQISLEYWDPNSPASQHITRGPFRLSSVDTYGSELQLDVIRTPSHPVTVRITGTAYYESNSKTDLKPIETQDLVVKITADQLVTLSQ
jgi:hypothetical protein